MTMGPWRCASALVLKQPGRAHGHGAVQEDGQRARQFPFVLELCNRMQHRLCPAHGKHRHHGHAAALGQAFEGRAQILQHVGVWVFAVAVGGFDQHGIGCRRCVGSSHQHVVAATQVARKKNAPPAHFQQHAGGAQDVPRMAELCAPTGDGFESLAERVGAQLLEAVQCIQPCVQRQCGLVLGQCVAVEVGGVLFLQVAAVGQQNGAQIARAGGAVDRLGVAVARQQRQVAAVVQLRMGKHHGVNLVRRDGQWLPVAQAQQLVALEQPAVEQQAVAVVADEVFGAGDGAGPAQKGDADGHGGVPFLHGTPHWAGPGLR
jgi:hypothetical protein